MSAEVTRQASLVLRPIPFYANVREKQIHELLELTSVISISLNELNSESFPESITYLHSSHKRRSFRAVQTWAILTKSETERCVNLKKSSDICQPCKIGQATMDEVRLTLKPPIHEASGRGSSPLLSKDQLHQLGLKHLWKPHAHSKQIHLLACRSDLSDGIIDPQTDQGWLYYVWNERNMYL